MDAENHPLQQGEGLSDFSQADIEVAVAIGYTLAASIAMWMLTTHQAFKEYFYRKYGASKGNVRHIFTARYLSALIMAPPLLIYALTAWNKNWDDLGLTVKSESWPEILISAAGVIPLVILSVYPASLKKEHHAVYPTIRRMEWKGHQVATYLVSWAIYLFSYEVLYRGILFFICLDHMGMLAASAINIALYAATHAYKGYGEVFGSILAGIAICAVAYQTDSFLIGALIHIEMSWINFYFTYRARRKIRSSE